MMIIIGLGNPGKEYAHSRHNVGFRCIEHLARQHSVQVKKGRCLSLVGGSVIGEQNVLLVKPKTYVNRSGDAASKLLKEYRATPEDIVVICDDLSLPLGRLRIRPGGSAGGHNGLKSIISSIGSQDFPRIRIGIGRPHQETGFGMTDPVVDHVLGNFLLDEEVIIKDVVSRAAEAVEYLIAEGITSTMNRFN